MLPQPRLPLLAAIGLVLCLGSLARQGACHGEPRRTAERLHGDSVAAGQGWVLVILNNADSAWFDRQSIVRLDSTRFEAWVRYRHPRVAGEWKARQELDCVRNRQRNLEMHRLDLEGKAVASASPADPPWRGVTPESTEENVFRAVCGFAGIRNLPIVPR